MKNSHTHRDAAPGNEHAPRLLTVSEVLSRFRLSRATFYSQVRSGRIRLRKCGRRSLIAVEDMETWLEALPVAPMTKAG